jgi:hypothetical protein
MKVLWVSNAKNHSKDNLKAVEQAKKKGLTRKGADSWMKKIKTTLQKRD